MSAIRETITLTRTQTAGQVVAEEINVPTQLGPVRLRREIGRGGMGVVHLGRHELLDRDVAVKFLLHVVAGENDPAFTQFLTGARAASAVRHAALNTIHHADIVEGVPYLVMEYIDGPSLRDALRDRGRLGLAATLGVLHVVCDAIGELHDRDIVHHDIKPSNILLNRDGNIFVTDFGLAAVRKGGGEADPLVIAGSPAYMAPELFDGVASLRTDVYALGVMAYELLSGELPFAGDLASVRRHHAESTMPREAIDRAGVAPAVVAVIERAMHKQPVFRYKSARHFLTALEEAVPDRTVWIRGESNLADLAVIRGSGAGTSDTAVRAPDEGSSSYYDRLAARAAAKRAGTMPAAASEEAEDESASHAIDETLMLNVLCVGCGYDLRGLPHGRPCPECNRAMADSVHPGRLVFADVRWREQLHRGFGWLLFGVIGFLATTLVATGIGMLWEAAIRHSARNAENDVDSSVIFQALKPLDLAGGAVTFIFVAILLLAIFSITAPEPGGRIGVTKLLAQIAAIIAPLVLILQLGGRAFGYLWVSLISGSVLISGLLVSLACVSWVAGEIATRFPDPLLQRRFRLVGRLLVAAAAVGAFILIALVVQSRAVAAGHGAMPLAFTFTLGASQLLMIVLLLVGIPLLVLTTMQMRHRLAHELQFRIPFDRAFSPTAPS